MNFFLCNQYDSKNEDIYMITPKTPFDKSNLISKKNINSIKPYKLIKIENEKNNNLSNNIEESEELQIIDYPYQSHQIYYNLNSYCFNKSKINNSSIENKKFSIFNCYNCSKNNKNYFYEDKIMNDIKKMKNSFSYMSNPNFDNIENIIKNKFCDKNIDIDDQDTIKGEDNFNISKLNIRKNERINNIKNIPNNKYNNKSLNKDNSIKYGGFYIPKIYTNNSISYNKKKVVTERNKKYKKKIANLSLKDNIKSKENQYNHINKKITNNLNINKKDNLSFNNNYINNNKCLCNPRKSSKRNNLRNLIYKNNSNNNIYMNRYKEKEHYYNEYINDNKKIIDIIKKKIKNDMKKYKKVKTKNHKEK